MGVDYVFFVFTIIFHNKKLKRVAPPQNNQRKTARKDTMRASTCISTLNFVSKYYQLPQYEF
jgi:hypothetical protein